MVSLMSTRKYMDRKYIVRIIRMKTYLFQEGRSNRGYYAPYSLQIAKRNIQGNVIFCTHSKIYIHQYMHNDHVEILINQ